MKNLSKKNWYSDELIWWSRFQKIMNKQWLLNDKLNMLFRKPIDKIKIDFLFNKDGTLLDVGCGSGHFSHMMHKLGMNVIGIDFSNEQITQARNDINKNYNNNIDFICQDIFKWDYSKYINYFESIHIEAILHHLHDEDIEKFFKIISLLLKSNGKIYMYEPLYYEFNEYNNLKNIILLIYSKILSVITSKIPILLNLVDEELIHNSAMGYTGMSPHERALLSNEFIKLSYINNFEIVAITPERYKSIGYFLSLMTIKESSYRDILIYFSPVIILIDKFLFKFFPYQKMGSKYDFLLYSVKIKKNS